jgi:hypothetical protein
MNTLITDCVCRVAKQSLARNTRQTVFLTSSENARPARLSLASVLPAGSICDGHGVWLTPDGASMEVRKYAEEVPAYREPVAFHPCYGGLALNSEEMDHVRRWRKSVPTLGA